MKKLLTLSAVLFTTMVSAQDINGAWKNDNSTITFSSGYFSISEFDASSQSFGGTKGGAFAVEGKKVVMTYEYHTWNAEQVGTEEALKFLVKGDELKIGDYTYTRADDGTPGELNGAWLITGRMRDGEIRERTPGPRKTMKILSGTRFQWIAYNTETRQFMGTGGGSYTTADGKYTENIEFFSRDSTRVGASLEFNFELKDGKWHHSGKSSKGTDIYEVWSLREE